MNYTHDFPLKCSDLLKQHTLDLTSQSNECNNYYISVKEDHPMIEILNAELVNLKLPMSYGVTIFKRKFASISPHKVHVDRSSQEEVGIINASIVIPVEGFENTFMYWMNGLYEEQLSFTENKIPFNRILWLSSPKIMSKVEITSSTLCRVNIPHSATSRLDGTYRTVLSIRLKGNPSYEEILEKRNI